MSIPIAIAARPRRRFNWSQLSLVSLAGLSALAILILLGMIVWMSLRVGRARPGIGLFVKKLCDDSR